MNRTFMTVEEVAAEMGVSKSYAYKIVKQLNEEYIENDIPNIVCVQPFACLPNHVVGKGVIKTIRNMYPEANIVPVDYDPGASEANQTNRIKLLMTVAKDNLKMKQKERTKEKVIKKKRTKRKINI